MESEAQPVDFAAGGDRPQNSVDTSAEEWLASGVAEETQELGRDHTGASSAETPPKESQSESQSASAIQFHDKLECTVSDPRREGSGSKDSYVSYKVHTESNMPIFQKSVMDVRRRFTDFVLLAEALSRDYQAIAIPPLPSKHKLEYIRGDRFGADFTTKRCFSLGCFVRRLTLHPILRRSPHLAMFLESSDWNAYTRSAQLRSSSAPTGSSYKIMGAATGGSSGGGSGGGAGGSGGSRRASIESQAYTGDSGSAHGSSSVFEGFGDALLNAFAKISNPDARFVKLRESADKLMSGLSSLEKLMTKLVRRESELEDDFQDFSQLINKLAMIEPALESSLHAFERSLKGTSVLFAGLRDHVDQEYITALHDLEGYVASFRSLLKARDQKQLDHEALADYLQRSIAERDSLQRPNGGGSAGGFIRHKVEDLRGVDHEQSRRDRLRKTSIRVEELERETERAKIQSEAFNSEVLKENEILNEIRAAEVRASLDRLAQAHVDFYRGMIAQWREFIPASGRGD